MPTLQVTLSDEQAKLYGLQHTDLVSLDLLIAHLNGEQAPSHMPDEAGESPRTRKSNIKANLGILKDYTVSKPSAWASDLRRPIKRVD